MFPERVCLMMHFNRKVLVPAVLGATALVGWIAGCTASAESANRLTVSPRSLSINASLGITASAVLSATNGGTRSIEVRRINVTGDGFSVASSTFPVTIPAGESKSLAVKYRATRSGNVQGTLEILTNEQNEPVVVRLYGGASSSTPTVHSVTISPSSASLTTNGSMRFAASVQGAEDNDSVTWTASTGTITSYGAYTAPSSAGTVTITATSSTDPSKSASATVVVTAKPAGPPSPAPVTSVVVSPVSASSTTNGRIQFVAAVQGASANTSVVWTASSGTITTTGLYTASANPGTATITATSNADPTQSASAIVVITVAPLPPSPGVTSVAVSPSTASSNTSSTLTFTASVLGTTSDKSVTWSASLGNITSSGTYTAPSSPGTATVTARSNADPTKFASATVKVNAVTVPPPPSPIVTSVTVSPSTASSITTGTLPFTATVLGTTSDKSVTWSASLGNITSSGAYTAPSSTGTATVTARSNADPTKFASAAVKIIAAPPAPPPTPTPTPLPSPNPASNTIPPTFFGQTWNSLEASHFPSVPFGTVRLWDTGTSWQQIETSRGVYNWSMLDKWLAMAGSHGQDVLYTFGRVPVWISSNAQQPCGYGSGCAAPPSDITSGDTAFKEFVIALVNHSKASSTPIKYYELWNEPNYLNFWTGTAAQLAIMTNDADAIIHALDANALTVGPSPTGHNPNGWISDWYAAGGTHDIGSYHTSSSIATTLADADNVRTVMAANGDGAKPLWVTEGNWGAVANGTLTNDQKVAFLAQEYLLLWNKGIARYYWYAWDNTHAYGPLWDTINGVHPAGTAYGLLYDWLAGSTYSVQPCSQAADATWTCTLTLSDGSPAEIVWNPNSSLSFSTTFAAYRTLDNTTVNSVIGTTVVIGNKPILLN
jgi:hypothetical protein